MASSGQADAQTHVSTSVTKGGNRVRLAMQAEHRTRAARVASTVPCTATLLSFS